MVGMLRHRGPDQCDMYLDHHVEDYVMEMPSDRSLSTAGLFDAQKATKLLQKLRTRRSLSEMDNMAFASILSSMITYNQFIRNFSKRNGKLVRPDLVVDQRSEEGNLD